LVGGDSGVEAKLVATDGHRVDVALGGAGDRVVDAALVLDVVVSEVRIAAVADLGETLPRVARGCEASVGDEDVSGGNGQPAEEDGDCQGGRYRLPLGARQTLTEVLEGMLAQQGVSP
jgi:hypothetical protein